MSESVTPKKPPIYATGPEPAALLLDEARDTLNDADRSTLVDAFAAKFSK